MAQSIHEFHDDPRNADIRIWVNGELKPRAEAVVSVFDSGFVLGENESVLKPAASVRTAATQGSDVGRYATVASGAASPNYTISYVNGNLDITPAALIVTAPSASRPAGLPNPALAPIYSGFVHGQDASVLDSPAPTPA